MTSRIELQNCVKFSTSSTQYRDKGFNNSTDLSEMRFVESESAWRLNKFYALACDCIRSEQTEVYRIHSKQPEIYRIR